MLTVEEVFYYRKTDAPTGIEYEDIFALKKPIRDNINPTDRKDIKLQLHPVGVAKNLISFNKSLFKNFLVR